MNMSGEKLDSLIFLCYGQIDVSHNLTHEKKDDIDSELPPLKDDMGHCWYLV